MCTHHNSINQKQILNLTKILKCLLICLPATEKKLVEITQKQKEDEVCKQLKEYCQSGWPNKHQVPDALKPYYSLSAELTIQQGILTCNNRIVVPSSLRPDMLNRLHTGHQGITKCRRALWSVWWPGLSK